MILRELKIQGLKCYRDSGSVPTHHLTIFIGENDSGKSSIKDAIELLLTNRFPIPEDYFRNATEETAKIIIEGTFEFDSPGQCPPELQNFLIDGNKIRIKKEFDTATGMNFFAYKSCFIDERFERLDDLDTEALKVFLEEIGLAKQPSNQKRIAAVREFIATSNPPQQPNWLSQKFSTFAPFLPVLHCYASSDYGTPTALVKKTLDTAYRSHFYETPDSLKPPFQTMKGEITRDLNDKIHSSLFERLKRYDPAVVGIEGDFEVDFAKGLNFIGLKIDTGAGLQPVDQRGEGAKKKLFLTLLEWDNEVSRPSSARSIIKIYDEPDANLHYDAQRNLFKILKKAADDRQGQIIVITHSLAMVDRAPAGTINLVEREDDGTSKINFLKGKEDSDIKDYLHQVSNLGGIRNSSIFYERCLLLVEGVSEDNAIPILYKKYTGKSLGQDGIVLINLESNGAWKNFLKLLSKNKQDCTLLLLDSDTQNPASAARITPGELQAIGFDTSFLTDNVVFIGQQEFEDALPESRIAEVLNSQHPKAAPSTWTLADIQRIKALGAKFSDKLIDEVGQHFSNHRTRCRKPDLSRNIATLMDSTDIASMPSLVTLFAKIQSIVE